MNEGMSDEHKQALARGRAESRIVKDYLEALRETKPKRGRKRTPETVEQRLTAVTKELETADALTELLLVQEQHDLMKELLNLRSQVDVRSFEHAFVQVAVSYSKSKKIDYSSWREVGVPAEVLKRAGLTKQ